MCRVIGYLRISTNDQDNANQKPAILDYAAAQGLEVSDWVEAQVSSRKGQDDRKIGEVLASLGRGDHLIVVELSRLGRSIFEGVDIIKRLRDRGATVHGVRDHVRTNGKGDAQSDFLISVQFFFAQTERERISERTKAALAAKREDLIAQGKGFEGKGFGNPRLHVNHAKQREASSAHAETLRPILADMRQRGMTQRAMIAELNSRGVPTAKGGKWALLTLQRVAKRLELV